MRLPPGLDPDDLIRQRGARAMEQLLAAPDSLLDTLWQYERDAQPLTSPEAKAGLKARLNTHVETIADPDIKALYRRELMDRFSAFAFPQRERKPWKQGGFQKGGRPPQPQADPAAVKRLQRLVGGGSRDRLATAVVAGLIRFPDQIDIHADALSEAAERDAKVAELINPLLDMAEMLEHGDAAPISGNTGPLAAPDKNRFAFLSEATDPEAAREDLAEAVSLLVERPALEAALAAATARFETDPEGAFAEQQRLLKRKLEFEARLGQMASLRAARRAGHGQQETGHSPASETAGEQETD